MFTSSGSVQRLWRFDGWLHSLCALQVSCFAVLCLADFHRFDFDSSLSMSPFNVSVQTFCRLNGLHE